MTAMLIIGAILVGCLIGGIATLFFVRSAVRDTAAMNGKILQALEAKPGLSGSGVCRVTNLTPAVVYPSLMDLESAGVIISAWADSEYPRQRIYRARKGATHGAD